MKKTVFLYIIIVYTILRGIGGSFAGVVMILTAPHTDISLAIFIYGFVFLTISLMYLYLSYALIALKAHGLRIGKWLYGVYIPLGIISIFPLLPGTTMTAQNTVTQLIGIAISFGVIYYFSRPNIKDLYVQNT